MQQVAVANQRLVDLIMELLVQYGFQVLGGVAILVTGWLIARFIETIRAVIHKDPRVVREQEPKIGIAAFADSSINLTVRLWCKQRDALDVLFGINKGIAEEFRRNDITIPFPQREVRLSQHVASNL